jgi:hypothetical protein
VGGVIHVPPSAAPSDLDGAGGGINSGIVDEREINDQAAVAHSQTPRIVPSAANSEEHVVVPPEVDRSHDVGRVCTPRDKARVAIDHTIVDFPRRVIPVVIGLNELSSEACFEGCYR